MIKKYVKGCKVGGTINKAKIDSIPPVQLDFNLARIMLGVDFKVSEIKNKLKYFGIIYKGNGFVYPPYRTDIDI
jgi:phenylalanyl-tRNA synthetase beta subunit